MKQLPTLGLALCLCLAADAKADSVTYLAPASDSSALANAAPASDPSVVWSTTDGGNGHTYTLTPTRGTWTAEEAFAVSVGGHLVSINSQAEQTFLISNFLVGSTATVPLWIGLTDQTSPGFGTYNNWTTGEPVTFTNFNPGEPNDQNGIEGYVAMNWHYSFGSSTTMGTWNDLANGGSTVSYNDTNARALGPYYGIVEVVPEPGTVCMLGLAGLFAVSWRLRRRNRVQFTKRTGR